MQRRQHLSDVASQSLRAPGLPFYPVTESSSCPPPVKGAHGNSRLIDVVSVNYDYLPMNLFSPKTFWVDLRSPAPKDLQVGKPARIHLSPNCGIQTTFSENNIWNSIFQVDDIVGSRVILSPYKGSTWLPTVHEACDNPFGWGYDTNQTNKRPLSQYSKYGYGTPIAALEYTPQYYSSRASRLEAAQIEEDYYRGRRQIPGWLS